MVWPAVTFPALRGARLLCSLDLLYGLVELELGTGRCKR